MEFLKKVENSKMCQSKISKVLNSPWRKIILFSVVFISVVFGLSFFSHIASATDATCRWLGTTNTQWGRATNWKCSNGTYAPNDGVPASTYYWVSINNTATNQPWATSTVTVSGLVIGTSSSATVNIGNGGSIVVENSSGTSPGVPWVEGAIIVGPVGTLNFGRNVTAGTCLNTTESAATTSIAVGGKITTATSTSALCTWDQNGSANFKITNAGEISGKFSMNFTGSLINTGTINMSDGTTTSDTTAGKLISCNNTTRSNNKFYHFTNSVNTYLNGSCEFDGNVTVGSTFTLNAGGTGTHEVTGLASNKPLILLGTGTFLGSSTSNWLYSRAGPTTIATTTYGGLWLQPASSQTYTVGSDATKPNNLVAASTTIISATLDLNTYNASTSITGNVTIGTSGTLSAPATAVFKVGGNWSNSGGTFTSNNGSTTFIGISAQNLYGTMTGSSAFATTTFSGAGAKTFRANASTTSNFNINSGSGVVTAPSSGLLTIGGNFINSATVASFVHNSGTVYLSGSGRLLTSAGTTFNNLNIIGSYTTTDYASTTNLTIADGGIFTVDTGDYATTSTSINLNTTGTLTGNGTTTVQHSSWSGTGTISCNIRFDASNGDLTIPARTYGNSISMYNASATNRNVTMGAGTFVISKNLLLNANGAGNIILTGLANNPIVDIGLRLDFSGVGAGTETIVSGANLWAISGSVDLTGGTFTATAGNTLTMDGAGTLTLAGSAPTWNNLYNFNASSTITISGNATTTNDFWIDTTGAVTAPASTNSLYVGGNFKNQGTFTNNSGTVYLTGTSKTITSNGTKFNNLIIAGSITTIDNASTTNLNILDGKTLTVDTGDFATTSTSINLNTTGILTGNGTTTVQFTNLTTAGTISCNLRFDSSNGDIAVQARTYGANVSIYNASATNRNVTMAGGTYNITGALLLNASGGGNVTLVGATNNPIVSIGGSFDLVGQGAGTETVTSGIGYWKVSGAVDFTGGTYTATAGNTLVMNGSGGILTLAGSAGSWNNLYNFNASSTITISGNATTTNNFWIDTTGNVTGPGSTKSLYIGGNYNNQGTYNNNSTRVFFYSASPQTLSGNMTNSSSFGNVDFSGAGIKTFNNNASTSDFVIQATSGAVGAPSSGLLSIAGNYTNSGTFTANSSTVYISGATAGQMFSGTMTNSSSFSTLQIINNSGTNPDSSPSVIFADPATATNFIITTPSVKVRFNVGSTYTFTTINWNGQNTGTRVALRSSTPDSVWLLVVSGSQTVSNVDAKDSDASGGPDINADGTCLNSGNNPHWIWPSSILVSGFLYADEAETSPIPSKGIKVSLRGGTPYSASTNSGGDWSVTLTSATAAGNPIAIWVSGDTNTRAFTLTKATSTASNITGLRLYQNKVILRHEGDSSATSTTNADLSWCDADSGCGASGDPDIQFTANAGALSVKSGQELHIWTGKGFLPGGAITLFGSHTSAPDGDFHIDDNASTTLSGAFSVAGNWATDAGATFMAGGQTVTFNATTTGKTIGGTLNTATTTFGAIAFNGSGGSWAFSNNASTTDFTITSGSVTAPSLLSVAGNYTNNSGSFYDNSGTVYFTGSSKTLSGTMIGASYDFNNVVFTGSYDLASDNASTTDFTVTSTGNVTCAVTARMLSIAGNYSNSGTFSYVGTKYFSGISGSQTLSGTMTGSSAFAGLGAKFIGGATKTFLNDASTTFLYIDSSSGTVTAPNTGLLTIGQYTNNGTFSKGNSTIYFDVGVAQAGNMTGNSALGNVIIAASGVSFSNNASTTDFTIASGASVTAPSLLSVAGNYTNNSGSFYDNSGTIYFTGSSKTLSGTMIGANYDFNNVVFSGSYAFSNNASTTNFTIESSGSVDVSLRSITIAGNYTNNNGTINKTGSSIFYFTGSSPTISGTLTGNPGSLPGLVFNISGTATFSGNASTTSGTVFTITSGTVVAPSLLTIRGNFTNSGTFNAGSGDNTVYFSTATIISLSGTMTGNSKFNHLIFGVGSGGSYTFNNNASTTDLTTNFATIGVSGRLITIAGNYSRISSGSLTKNSSTKFYFTGSGKTLSGNMTGAATSLPDVEFLNSGSWTFQNNASTTNFTITSGTVTAPSSGLLSIAGNYSNSGTFTRNNSMVFLNGSSQQTLSGAMTGDSAFYNLTILNNYGSGNATSSPSVIFSSNASTTATFAANIGDTTIRFLAGGQYTFQNIDWQGTSGQPIKVRSSDVGTPPPDHTKWQLAVPGTKTILYVDFMDVDASYAGNSQIDVSGDGNIDSGNNTNITFVAASASISSAMNKTYEADQTSDYAPQITISVTGVGVITDANNLRIAIATSTVHMLWNTDISAPGFGGNAQGKVSPSLMPYEGGNSVLVIEVLSSFTANDTLIISGLSFKDFTQANAPAVALQVFKDGPSDIVSDANDSKTVAIKGKVTVANSDAGQPSNKFNISSGNSVTDALLFNFKMTPAGENANTTITVALSGVHGFSSANITPVSLYIDYNGNGIVDGGDSAVGGSGNVSINGTSGTITFSEFLATTTRNYIMQASVSSIDPGDELTIGLPLSNSSSTGAVSTLLNNRYGTVPAAWHSRVSGISGGEGTGGSAPPSYVQGGGSVAPSPGQEIGGEIGFVAPSATGPQDNWNTGTGANAFVSDNVYAITTTPSASEDYGGFSFSVPGTNTIDGVEVKIEGMGLNSRILVALSSDAGETVTATKATGTMTSSDVVYRVGGGSEKWGRTWTPANFSSNFRVRIIFDPQSGSQAQVDAIQVRVYSHAGGASGGGGGGEI